MLIKKNESRFYGNMYANIKLCNVKPRFGFFYEYYFLLCLTYLFNFIWGSIVKYNKYVIL
jgi:hypothetical protein